MAFVQIGNAPPYRRTGLELGILQSAYCPLLLADVLCHVLLCVIAGILEINWLVDTSVEGVEVARMVRVLLPDRGGGKHEAGTVMWGLLVRSWRGYYVLVDCCRVLIISIAMRLCSTSS